VYLSRLGHDVRAGILKYTARVSLPPCRYDASLLVKDVNDSYKAVLVRDHLKFETTNSSP